MAKTNRKPDELVIRIKDARLRQHIEDKAQQTGSTPEALVNEVFDDLETAWRTIRLYMTQMEEQRREQRREREELLKEVEKYLRKEQEEVKSEYEQNKALSQKMLQSLEAVVNVARSWRESAEKAIALCRKFEVKTGYLEMVRRQRDDLIGLVERFMDGKKVYPDEVGEIYAIAEKGLIDRMIDRIEITAPPDIAPFNPDPLPPSA
jgi:hypothetical protein